MSYCPKCKYEFEDKVKVCPDCNIELLEHIPEDHTANEKLVRLTKLNSAVKADMVKEALEENDIFCLEKSDMFHSAFATENTAFAGGEVEIFVVEEKLTKAQNVLNQLNERVT